MEPFFTNDAIVLGILLIVLGGVFYTSSLESPGWKKFYRFVPALLLCYFLPALLHYPLGLIASDWFDNSLLDRLNKYTLHFHHNCLTRPSIYQGKIKNISRENVVHSMQNYNV